MEFPYPHDQHKARVMCNDPQALAYEWMVAYADSISGEPDEEYDDQTITVDELIEAAKSQMSLGPDEGWWGGDYICKGGLLEGVSVDPMFWEKLSIFLDQEIEQHHRNNFFSCSC